MMNLFKKNISATENNLYALGLYSILSCIWNVIEKDQ